MSEHGEDIKDLGPEGEAFLKRYKRDGYLLNEDFSELIQLIRDDAKESGIYDVLNGEVSPLEGWTRIPCDVCGKTLGDALVDARESWGRFIIDVCQEEGWGHVSCHKKEDATEAKKGLDELINTGV